MDGTTVIFPNGYVKSDGSEHGLEIMFSDFLVEIEVGNELIRLSKVELEGILAMMNALEKQR